MSSIVIAVWIVIFSTLHKTVNLLIDMFFEKIFLFSMELEKIMKNKDFTTIITSNNMRGVAIK